MGIKATNYQYLYMHIKTYNTSKREQEKTIEAAQKVAEDTKNIAQTQIMQRQVAAQEFQSTVNRSLDKTRENVRKSIDEMYESQIPRYTMSSRTIKNKH
jgi:hypothetical protein